MLIPALASASATVPVSAHQKKREEEREGRKEGGTESS